MHLYPSLTLELDIAGRLLFPLLGLHLIVFAIRNKERDISSLLEKIITWGTIIYNVAVGYFLCQCVFPIYYDWEVRLIEWTPVPIGFAFFLLLINTLYLVRYKNKRYENVLFVLSWGLLLLTLYEFVVTKPFEEQDATTLLREGLLEHAPLVNFVINAVVSLYFILLVGYRRKWL